MHWKKSLLVIHKILRLFVNTLTVDEKHHLLNRGNLTEPIQIQLSQKQKFSSLFFFAFLKVILNFKHLPKENGPNRWCISGNTDSEKQGEINVQKALFQRTRRDTTWQMYRTAVAIWMRAPLQYLLITIKVVALEKVSFIDTQNPKTVC